MSKGLNVYVSALKLLVKKYNQQKKIQDVGTKEFRDELIALIGALENDKEVNGIRCWIYGCDEVECLICTKEVNEGGETEDGDINDGAVLLGVELRVCDEDIGKSLWKTGTFPEDSEKIWARFSNAHLR
jgi:hypothetical protein